MRNETTNEAGEARQFQQFQQGLMERVQTYLQHRPTANGFDPDEMLSGLTATAPYAREATRHSELGESLRNLVGRRDELTSRYRELAGNSFDRHLEMLQAEIQAHPRNSRYRQQYREVERERREQERRNNGGVADRFIAQSSEMRELEGRINSLRTQSESLRAQSEIHRACSEYAGAFLQHTGHAVFQAALLASLQANQDLRSDEAEMRRFRGNSMIGELQELARRPITRDNIPELAQELRNIVRTYTTHDLVFMYAR